jgi:serine/threonine protein kinase
LGTGGNAVVFLVLTTSGTNQGSLFALKMFRRLSIPARRDRFMREIEFLVGCDHASITPIYDYGIFGYQGEEFPFLVTEYQPVTLGHVIRSGNVVKIEKISYILQILSALNYLSTFTPAIVHRDLKPQNIFINGPSCMLGDFGLIKFVNGEDEEEDRQLVVESRDVAMPFSYRTPDLISYARKESEITPKSDVFQLGLTAAELFTGRNPQLRTNNLLDELIMEPIGHIPGKYGGHISSLIQRMLVLDPNVRERAGELIDGWKGVFENVAQETYNLEGHVFSRK